MSLLITRIKYAPELLVNRRLDKNTSTAKTQEIEIDGLLRGHFPIVFPKRFDLMI